MVFYVFFFKFCILVENYYSAEHSALAKFIIRHIHVTDIRLLSCYPVYISIIR